MRVDIRCYGPAREAAGTEVLVLEVSAPATVADALAQLAAHSEAFATLLPRCAVAIGDDFVSRQRLLADGDEVALIPPISGG